jgi:hypothetical protein
MAESAGEPDKGMSRSSTQAPARWLDGCSTLGLLVTGVAGLVVAAYQSWKDYMFLNQTDSTGLALAWWPRRWPSAFSPTRPTVAETYRRRGDGPSTGPESAPSPRFQAGSDLRTGPHRAGLRGTHLGTSRRYSS